MIEKERLEELIKQGSTIYSTSWKEEIDLSQYWCEVFEMDWDGKIIYKLVVHEDDEHNPMYSLDGLTEDVEGAKWEEIQRLTHITRGEYRRGEWELDDLFFHSLKRQEWLNWLYDAVCGFDHPECEYDYIYPADKKEILKMIREGEIEV